uniref:Uncharacterized protein n=1 Tax=Arundo donax TaxID=35708 RepID=A0A0A9F407_ARUDO
MVAEMRWFRSPTADLFVWESAIEADRHPQNRSNKRGETEREIIPYSLGL